MPESGRTAEVVPEVDLSEWEELLASDPRALPFQHPRFLQRYLRHVPVRRGHWIQVRDGAGGLRAGMGFIESPRWGLLALAGGIDGTYGGPLSRDGRDPRAEEAVLEAFVRWGGRRVVRRELMWGHPEPPAAGGGRLEPVETAILDVRDGFDVFWRKTFSNNRRSECNRNEKRGLTAFESRDPAILESFHPLYRRKCREWGMPPLPLDLLQEILVEEERALLTVARFEGRVVGLHFCFLLPGELFAWLGTSERLRRVFPSTALMRANAEAALRRGLPQVNLGSSLGLHGVSQFKKLLGATAQTRWRLLQEARWLTTLRRVRGH